MLILIRHGQIQSNVLRLLDTALPGPDLTDTGRSQATTAGEKLGQRFGAGIKIYASKAQRARSTAELIAANAGWDYQGTIPGVAELDAGDWQLSGEEEKMAAYLDVLHQWISGNPAPQVPGGETFEAAAARARAGLGALTTGPEPVAVVSHGAFSRLALSVISDVDPDYCINHPFKNCEGAVVHDGAITHWGAF